jgi:plasminogen activator
MFRSLPLQILAMTLASIAGPTMAGERLITDPDSPYFLSDIDQSYADPDQNFVLRGSVGVASIVGNEHVYAAGNGSENLSLLQWESMAPIAKLDAKLRFGDAWTLRGHFDVALTGDSKMTDYDWIPPNNTGYGMDDWSHRSISPNTSLDWYLNGDIAVGRDLPISDALMVNVNGGFKYTDVEWTAKGGTFIYSTNAPRDTIGTIPDVPAVRYRQQLPTVFAGVDATVNDGPWSLEAGGRAGLIIYGQSVDHHYLRSPPRTIVDQLGYGQMLSADAKLGYAFSDHFGAFLEGSYEKTFAAHVPSDYYVTATGVKFIHDGYIGGAELDVASITAGFKGNF